MGMNPTLAFAVPPTADIDAVIASLDDADDVEAVVVPPTRDGAVLRWLLLLGTESDAIGDAIQAIAKASDEVVVVASGGHMARILRCTRSGLERGVLDLDERLYDEAGDGGAAWRQLVTSHLSAADADAYQQVVHEPAGQVYAREDDSALALLEDGAEVPELPFAYVWSQGIDWRPVPGANPTSDRPADGPRISADAPLDPRLFQPIEELEVKARISVTLQQMGITWMGDLIQMTPEQLLARGLLGRMAVNEVTAAVTDAGLSLSTTIDDWPALVARWQSENEPAG